MNLEAPVSRKETAQTILARDLQVGDVVCFVFKESTVNSIRLQSDGSLILGFANLTALYPFSMNTKFNLVSRGEL
jgi:hypothetical protein